MTRNELPEKAGTEKAGIETQMQELADGLLKCAPLILRNMKPYNDQVGAIAADASALAMKIQVELTKRGWLK